MSEVAELVGQEFGVSYRVKLPDSVVPPESYVPENYETRKRLRINKVLNFRDTIKFWAESLEVNHSSKFQ